MGVGFLRSRSLHCSVHAPAGTHYPASAKAFASILMLRGGLKVINDSSFCVPCSFPANMWHLCVKGETPEQQGVGGGGMGLLLKGQHQLKIHTALCTFFTYCCYK